MRIGGGGGGTVVVAVKREDGRGSQRAVRWAVDNLMAEADCLLLVHVMPIITSVPTPSGGSIPVKELDASVVELYVNDMRAKCEEILLKFKFQDGTNKIKTLLLEGQTVAFALLRYVTDSRTRSLVLGSCSSSYFARKTKDSELPSVVLKHAPDTCNIYVVSPNKIISNSLSPLLTTERNLVSHGTSVGESSLSPSSTESSYGSCLSDISHTLSQEHTQGFSDVYSSPGSKSSDQIAEDTISDELRTRRSPPKSSTCSDQSDIQAEIEQMHLKLENTITMYNKACEDLARAQSEVHLLSSACTEEAQKVNATQQRVESYRKMVAIDRDKYLEAEKEIEMAKKLLVKVKCERQIAELKAHKGSLEKQKIVAALISNDPTYRRYSRDEIQMATGFFSENQMIGEGAYGKVYKCSLDHTAAAIKVLCPDAFDRKEEFLREVEVLSHLRHPHIVLLLGACPENGSLVYEYMENGSLQDHIFGRKGKTPLPLGSRFRIAFEVARGLAFLHSAMPNPIVHRDLKPGNILLDKYYVSKISDVGLSRIISDAVADNVTEYKDTVVAGTLHYVDPEYARTGTLRPKSDLYSFGVIALQLLSARHPSGIITKFENAISSGSLLDLLDKSVADWPLAEAHQLAEIALNCCKLRCRDRPDLETEVLPTLERLTVFADSRKSADRSYFHAPKHFYCPILQEIMHNPHIAADGFTYEHEAIKAWLYRHNVSAVTKQRLQDKMLTPNHVLFSAIQEWRTQVASPRN